MRNSINLVPHVREDVDGNERLEEVVVAALPIEEIGRGHVEGNEEGVGGGGAQRLAVRRRTLETPQRSQRTMINQQIITDMSDT